VDSRRDGTWVYYRITEQEHASVKSVIEVLARTFGAERSLRSDHTRLKKNCGPAACNDGNPGPATFAASFRIDLRLFE